MGGSSGRRLFPGISTIVLLALRLQYGMRRSRPCVTPERITMNTKSLATVRRSIVNIAKSRRGANATEYMLVLALVTLSLVAGANALRGKINSKAEDLGGKVGTLVTPQ
jgi:Flp pilus assembly pilin Flp